MSLDPNLSAEDQVEDPQSSSPANGRTSGEAPASERGNEPIRTLLWTAASVRPLDEVAALVSLLKRTGEVPSPGDEALRAAAVSRTVAEVRQLVVMLTKAPHEVDEADTALRAAAVGRPIEDVAQLVSILGSEGRAVPAAALPPNGTEARSNRSDTVPQSGPALAPEASDALRSWARRVPAMSDYTPRAGAESGNDRAPGPRSVLRWPAAAALLLCGVIHLPMDLAALRSGGFAELLTLAFTALCLVLGVWLAVQDTAWIWGASGATAIGIIAAHSLSGAGGVDLLEGSLGDSFAWAQVAAVACAVLAVGLAGSVLMRREKAAEAAGDG